MGMMKCHKDKHQDSEQEEVDELLGETYNPKNAENYKATGGKCSVKSVQNELNALPAGDKSDARCQVTCETSSVDKDNYTAECSGTGNAACFLKGSETFQRGAASAFLTWKSQCVGK